MVAGFHWQFVVFEKNVIMTGGAYKGIDQDSSKFFLYVCGTTSKVRIKEDLDAASLNNHKGKTFLINRVTLVELGILFSNNCCHSAEFSTHERDARFYSDVMSEGVSACTVLTRCGYLMQRAVAAHYKIHFRSSGNRTRETMFHKAGDGY